MDPFSILVIGLLALIISASILGRAKTTIETRRQSVRLFLLGGSVAFLSGLVLFFPGYADGNPTGMTYWGVLLAVVGGVAITLGFGVLIANAASEKGRSWIAFFFLSFFVSPVIMGIIAAAISPLPGSIRYQGEEPASKKKEQPSASAAEQIEKLGGLLEKGLISQEEFDDKKRELLGRI